MTLAVALGGALGTLVRYQLSTLLVAFDPWDLWLANFVGTLLLASSWHHREGWHPAAWQAFGVGFCGGLTSVSTLVGHLHGLIATQAHLHAALYLSATLVSGFLGAAWGLALSHAAQQRKAAR